MTAWFSHWVLESPPASSWSSSCPDTSWHTWHSNNKQPRLHIGSHSTLCFIALLCGFPYIFPVSAFLQPYTSPKPPLPMIRCTLKSFMVSWGWIKEQRDFNRGRTGVKRIFLQPVWFSTFQVWTLCGPNNQTETAWQGGYRSFQSELWRGSFAVRMKTRPTTGLCENVILTGTQEQISAFERVKNKNSF